mmetsp:Transcript_32821/g.106077  ORF Transcript_32821/g.106077 Transcript_32821/m.106077 type:complete len:289 (+) Transcript_32821:2004-2870(+)
MPGDGRPRASAWPRLKPASALAESKTFSRESCLPVPRAAEHTPRPRPRPTRPRACSADGLSSVAAGGLAWDHSCSSCDEALIPPCGCCPPFQPGSWAMPLGAGRPPPPCRSERSAEPAPGVFAGGSIDMARFCSSNAACWRASASACRRAASSASCCRCCAFSSAARRMSSSSAWRRACSSASACWRARTSASRCICSCIASRCRRVSSSTCFRASSMTERRSSSASRRAASCASMRACSSIACRAASTIACCCCCSNCVSIAAFSRIAASACAACMASRCCWASTAN